MTKDLNKKSCSNAYITCRSPFRIVVAVHAFPVGSSERESSSGCLLLRQLSRKMRLLSGASRPARPDLEGKLPVVGIGGFVLFCCIWNAPIVLLIYFKMAAWVPALAIIVICDKLSCLPVVVLNASYICLPRVLLCRPFFLHQLPCD